MKTEVVKIVHDVRNNIHVLKNLVHFYMSGDQRYTALQELVKIERNVNLIWSHCLGCKGEDEVEGLHIPEKEARDT